MRILLVDVNCKFGSTGKIIYNLYTHLNYNNHNAAICYGRGKLIKEHNIFRISSPLEVYAHAVLTRITGLTGFFSPFSTFKLISIIKKFKPDIIHLHELHGYYINFGLVVNYIKKKKIKTVWTFHCEFMYTGKCGHSNDCNKWLVECHSCPQLRKYPSSLFFDFTRYMYNSKKKLFKGFCNLNIISPSIWLSERIKNSFLKNYEIAIINNGIDTKVFCPKDSSELKQKHNIKNEKIILAVAPDLMSEEKGGKWIIQLAKELDTNLFKIIMIGVYDSINLIKSDNIIVIKKITDQNLLSLYYSLADIFVICSKKENYPTTCLESIACGTPVIGFDTGGTKETVPKEYGIFVNYGDIKSLYKVLISCLGAEYKKKYYSLLVDYAKHNLSTENMYNNYLLQYKKLLLDDKNSISK